MARKCYGLNSNWKICFGASTPTESNPHALGQSTGGTGTQTSSLKKAGIEPLGVTSRNRFSGAEGDSFNEIIESSFGGDGISSNFGRIYRRGIPVDNELVTVDSVNPDGRSGTIISRYGEKVRFRLIDTSSTITNGQSILVLNIKNENSFGREINPDKVPCGIDTVLNVGFVEGQGYVTSVSQEDNCAI